MTLAINIDTTDERGLSNKVHHTYLVSFLYKLCYSHGMLTFKTEVLCLVSNVQLVKHFIMINTALPCFSLAVTLPVIETLDRTLP